MPSQSRALEASFEPSDTHAGPLGADTGPALEDFDSFFEKLNKLEPPEWRKAHPANPEQPMSAAAHLQPAAKPAEKKSAAMKPTDPGHAAKSDPLAGLRAAMAQARQAQRVDPALKARRVRGRIPGAFKFALTALVLFVVGMGIGWAVLSLPDKLGDAPATASAPAKPLTVESKSDTVLLTPPADKRSDAMAAIVPLTEVAPGSAAPKAEAAPHPEAGLAVDQAAAQAADAQNSDAHSAQTAAGDKQSAAATDGLIAPLGATDAMAPAETPAVAGAAAPAATQAKHAPARTKPVNPPRVAAIPAVPAASANPDSGIPAMGDGHYAVQVGACRSTKCVDNYRKLIAEHLPSGSDRIRVVAVATEGKDTGMQRVRVAPLDKAAAQQLRTALIQADPRLSAAYVVEFRQ